jgi:hypothetical protein
MVRRRRLPLLGAAGSVMSRGAVQHPTEGGPTARKPKPAKARPAAPKDAEPKEPTPEAATVTAPAEPVGKRTATCPMWGDEYESYGAVLCLPACDRRARRLFPSSEVTLKDLPPGSRRGTRSRRRPSPRAPDAPSRRPTWLRHDGRVRLGRCLRTASKRGSPSRYPPCSRLRRSSCQSTCPRA